MNNRRAAIYLACDTTDIPTVRTWAQTLRHSIDGLKLGLEFFCAHGLVAVRDLQNEGLPIFLDVKLKDIPNTVSGAVKSLAAVGVDYFNVHALGGRAMIQAAKATAQEVAAAQGKAPAKLLAVTILTSLEQRDLQDFGLHGTVSDAVLRLADMALNSGADGLVCSPQEVAMLRQRFGRSPIIVTPGIRPASRGHDDQKRVMTPQEAQAAGVDIMVIGRAITAAANPAAAAAAIAAELRQVA